MKIHWKLVTFLPHRSILIIFLGLILSPLKAQAGFLVGKGGDLVFCHGEGQQHNGYYSLDYLVTNNNDDEVAPIENLEFSMARMARLLKEKVPGLSPLFEEFSSQLFNRDPSQVHVWEPVPFELKNIDDEDLPIELKLPRHCFKENKLQLVQAVILLDPTYVGSKKMVYRYMPELVQNLAKHRPIQLSYLLIHEWLWSISDNVVRNRRINAFLHSKAFEEMDAKKAKDSLRGLGLPYSLDPHLTVAQDGSGDYRELPQAVSAASDYQTIKIRPGKYLLHRTLNITKPIRLIGEGEREKIIISNHYSDQPVLKIATVKPVNLSGLSIHNYNLSSTAKGNTPVILAEGTGHLEINSSDIFSGYFRAGVLIHLGPHQSLTMTESKLDLLFLPGTSAQHSLNAIGIFLDFSYNGTLQLTQNSLSNVGFGIRERRDQVQLPPLTKTVIKDNIFQDVHCPIDIRQGPQFKISDNTYSGPFSVCQIY